MSTARTYLCPAPRPAAWQAVSFPLTMQVLLYTDYALRVLLYVGSHQGSPVPASTIARAYGISPDHVAKATKALTRAGLLRATRGAGGGVELARSPSEVRLGDVVRQFEGDDGLVECFGTPQACRLTPSCALRVAFQRAEDAFFTELNRYTLADLLRNRVQLVRLLRPSERRRESVS